MDWLILVLGVPAILIPLVLLFGFAGCTTPYVACVDDSDCPVGTHCENGSCIANEPDPSAPESLHAISRDDHSVALTWTNTELAATDFEIERAQEGDDPEVIPAPADLSPTGATDRRGLQEGVTYIYRVRALVGPERSEFSDRSSATVLPLAPVNLRATPVNIDEIVLTWTNASTVATEFFVEHRVPGGVFLLIPESRGRGTTFHHRSLAEGTTHEYRVFAVVLHGVENSRTQEVNSAPSAIVSQTTLAFTTVFTAPPGTLSSEGAAAGFCVVQRLSHTLLAAGGNPTKVRIALRGPITGSLILDKVTISQTADSQPGATGTEDAYDAAPDLIEVRSNVTIAANAAVTVGPVNYALDATKDLLVAFDISNAANQGNAVSGPLTGADCFARAATAEAGVPDRTTGYPNVAVDTLCLVELIEVL